MSEKLKASIVIPVYNGEKTVRACLDSVFACLTDEYEVIAVNDGSTDQTAAILSEYPCKVIHLPINRGRGYARNRGIELAKAAYVLLTDADCTVSHKWAPDAIREIELLKQKDPRIVGAAGRVLPKSGFFNKCDAYSAYGYNQDLKPRYTDNFCTANLVVERDSILKAGLFNESLPTFEDLDLGLRILAAGGRLFYQPALAVIHNHTRLGLRGFLSHEYGWGRSIGNYFELQYPQYRRTPISRWMGSYAVYLLSSPLFAALITAKIIFRNITFDPSVISLAPFILLSKILFRVGALNFIKRQGASHFANNSTPLMV